MASTPQRQSTYPLSYSSRHKPRRWPLVLRFVKGSIHSEIAVPVILHSAWAALIVYLNGLTDGDFALPNGIIPSLSIVVGLMLVRRLDLQSLVSVRSTNLSGVPKPNIIRPLLDGPTTAHFNRYRSQKPGSFLSPKLLPS